MQNPDERDVDTPMRETGMIPFDSLESASLEPVEPASLPYKKEPLFNKKVMLVWALGAAAVWVAITFILPIAFDSAKSAIVQSIKEAEGAGSNPPPGTAAPGPAGATVAPPVPAQPAQPPQPSQSAQGSKKAEPSRR